MAEAAGTFGAAQMRAWVERAHDALSGSRRLLDELNVFPVPDSDTGTNLMLTLQAGRVALGELDADATLGEVALVAADGALVGARGNSGIILSQFLRAVGETFAEQSAVDGAYWAWALNRGSMSAGAAMAHPVEGTALTVVREAADAAWRVAYLERGEDVAPVAPVVLAAADGAREALARTPSLLEPLAESGVVDAGGAGFVLLLQALVDVVTGTSAPVPLVLTAPDAAGQDRTGDGAAVPGTGAGPGEAADACGLRVHPHTPAEVEEWQAGDYEVMYVLTATEQGADMLRDRLDRIGASVGVVGGVAPHQARGLWHVHVHTDEPMAAIEAAAGTPLRQVCVRYLRISWPTAAASSDRAEGAGTSEAGEVGLGVVACTAAPGLIAPLAESGAVVVLSDADGTAGGDGEVSGVRDGVARAVVDSGCAHVVVLPCGPCSAAAARAAVRSLSTNGGPTVTVLPSEDEAGVVAGVAAAGVGSPDDQLRSMAAAVARTRGARVEASATGVAHPGGPAGGLAEAALVGVRELVRAGDEVLTVILGQGVPGTLLEVVAGAARSVAPGIEVVALDGRQTRPALALGVE